MSENKLSREVLIEKLDWWRKIAHIGGGCQDRDVCNQAYEQIKEMIENYDEMKQEISLLKDVIANPGGLL